MALGTAGVTGKKGRKDDFSSAFAILKDAKTFEAKIAKMANAEKSLKEATDKYESLTILNRLRGQARSALTRAETKMKEATEESEALLAVAKEKITADRKAFLTEKGQVAEAARERATNLLKRETNVTENEKDYTRRMINLERREETAEKKTKENTEKARDLRRRLQVVKAAIAEANLGG